MDEVTTRDPRWGNEDRDRKATAIWNTLLQHLGIGIADGAWLDVGCGSGGIAAALAARARHVTGIDPEPWDAWSEARARRPNLALVAGTFDGRDVPFPEAAFDVVVCNQVYEHVRDPMALLRNIHRVLVPGGSCYFAGPNLLWPIEPHVYWPFVHWLPRTFAQSMMRNLGSKRAKELDAWSTTYPRLTAWFEDTGFEWTSAIAERVQAAHLAAPQAALPRIAASVPRGLYRALAPLSPGFVFVLRKPAVAA